MARLSLRDRFFTPPVARAMVSPSGILLAGAGAAAAIVAGLPLAVAAGAAGVAWAARVAFSIPRNARAERIDPFAIKEPWRHFVSDALRSQRQFDEAVGNTQKGPLRDRMAAIGERIEAGVGEAWRIARAGQALAEARSAIDVSVVMAKLGSVAPPGQPPPDPQTAAGRTVEALNAQLQSARRLEALVTDTQDRLRLLDARMSEAVARAIELSVRADGVEELGGLSQDIDDVVNEMEALRAALVETDASPVAPPGILPGEPSARPTGAPPPVRPDDTPGTPQTGAR
jgi:hypothetical protein